MCWQIGRCFVALFQLMPIYIQSKDNLNGDIPIRTVKKVESQGLEKTWKTRGGRFRKAYSSLIASCRLLADLMHVAEGNADEAWWTWHFKIHHAICTTATQLFKTSGIASKVPGKYIFKGTSPPISLDFYHFAATFGNFHNIESSSTQAGTSISRLRIQVLLPRHERHRAAVLAAKWRRLASVPLGSGPAVHRIDDMEKKHLFVPFNST